jgi:hypothetical protein
MVIFRMFFLGLATLFLTSETFATNHFNPGFSFVAPFPLTAKELDDPTDELGSEACKAALRSYEKSGHSVFTSLSGRPAKLKYFYDNVGNPHAKLSFVIHPDFPAAEDRRIGLIRQASMAVLSDYFENAPNIPRYGTTTSLYALRQHGGLEDLAHPALQMNFIKNLTDVSTAYLLETVVAAIKARAQNNNIDLKTIFEASQFGKELIALLSGDPGECERRLRKDDRFLFEDMNLIVDEAMKRNRLDIVLSIAHQFQYPLSEATAEILLSELRNRLLGDIAHLESALSREPGVLRIPRTHAEIFGTTLPSQLARDSLLSGQAALTFFGGYGDVKDIPILEKYGRLSTRGEIEMLIPIVIKEIRRRYAN